MNEKNAAMQPFHSSLALTGWKDPIGSAREIALTFPSGTSFTLNMRGNKWEDVSNLKLSTDRLWAYSLKYIWWIFVNDCSSKAINFVHEYYSTSPDNKKLFEANIPGSWDHSVALRLRLLSCMLEHLDEYESKKFRKYIESELFWVEQPGNVKKNNHGFMLITSVLVASVALTPCDPEYAVKLRAFAVQKLEQILESVFGQDYYCNENSPFYAHFYIHEMKRIQKQFVSYDNLSSLNDILTKYITNSQVALENIIHPSGDIPPMGDSSSMKTRYQSRFGTHHSIRTGFWIYKKNDLYLSFKCGFDTLVHKHVDDTSITLQYKGHDFIVDSGFSNYNYSDPRVLALRTQKSHSGVHFTELDNEHPASMFKKPHHTNAGIVVDSPSSVTGWLVEGGNNFISRSIRVVDKKQINIFDSFHSGNYKLPIQRFIVPKEVEVEFNNRSITLTKGDAIVLLTFDSELSINIFSAVDGKGAKGWISTKPNELLPANCIEVTSTSLTVIPSFTITLFENTSTK